MFGYVKPYQPELKISEFETYEAVYCGLCKELGKAYGPFARLTLNYDYAFMAMLFMSLRDNCGGFEKKCCAVNPFKKKVCACPCEDLSFVASAAMVMLYYKLKDDYADGGIFKKLCASALMLFVSPAKKRACKRYPVLSEIISAAMEKQAALEKQKETSIDQAADPSAEALGRICECMAQDEAFRRVLYRFGYLVGRYVYLTDAADDLLDDIKSGSYNPFALRAGITNPADEKLAAVREEARQAVYLTISQTAAAYELLEKKRFGPILDNIIYLGLPDVLNGVIAKGEKGRQGRTAG